VSSDTVHARSLAKERILSELVVLAFDDETGAAQTRDALMKMQKEHLITLEDAAVVVRRLDGKVEVHQAVNLVGVGALGGSFWGLLIGLIFWMPLLGMAVGAITGAISGKLTDIGVDDSFIKEVGNTIEPGNSALFLLVRDVTLDKVLDEVKKFKPKVLRSSLSKEDEARLRAMFSPDEEAES